MSGYARKVVVYQARDGWRWRAVTHNGNTVAVSGQKYGTRAHARRAAKAFVDAQFVLEG